MIYIPENFPQLKYDSSKVIAVTLWGAAFKNVFPLQHRRIAGSLLACIRLQTELITHMFICLSHLT